MLLSYRENPDFNDRIHEEDLQYMLKNTYTNTSFFLQAITKDSTTYTYWGDVQKNIYFVSDNMRDQFGFARNKVENLPRLWADHIFNENSKERYCRELADMVREKRTVHDMRYQVVDKNGKVFWIRCYGNLEWDKQGETPLFFCGKITQQDESFTIDPISSFPGEVVMLRQLERIKKENTRCLCIGFCLNGISRINSVQGRTYGNKLIHNICSELTAEFTGRMTFYRLDGMRFMAVVQPGVKEQPENLVDRIRQIAEENYEQMGMPITRVCSFAVLKYPQNGLTAIDFQENMIALIRLARDNGTKSFLDETAGDVLQLQQQTNMELLLNHNVQEGMVDFRPVVQPVVSTKTGRIIGGETLMRWKFDEKDVSPGVFIPLLEQDVLIQTAGRWILEQSAVICKKIIQKLPDFYLTVNVSLKQLHDPEFIPFIPRVLEKYQLDGRHLVLEMTESCMDKEPEKVQQLFEACAKLNIRIALDDFGTGYSSMRVLLKYPLSIVKIDRSLLLEMTESTEKSNFISSIVFACHKFGKAVCIEGVESEKQKELSAEADCDMIQGFYYYRPTEIPDLYSLIDKL